MIPVHRSVWFLIFPSFAVCALATHLAAAEVPRASAVSKTKPYFFIVGADPQLLFKQKDDRNWRTTIAHVNRLKPDFMIVCGDLVQALQNCGEISDDLAEARSCIRDGMAEIADFEGITGNLTFDDQGDPVKCAVIVKIENQEYVAYDSACP